MKLTSQVSIARRTARPYVLASSLLFALIILASSTARADTVTTFNVNAIVGNTTPSNEDTPGITGLAVTGTITIDTTLDEATLINLNVAGFNPFNQILSSPCVISGPSCVFYFNSGFVNYGELILGTTNPYPGGSLQAGSYIDLASNAYALTGSVSSSATPEPSPLILVLSGMIGLLFIWNRRRLLPSR